MRQSLTPARPLPLPKDYFPIRPKLEPNTIASALAILVYQFFISFQLTFWIVQAIRLSVGEPPLTQFIISIMFPLFALGAILVFHAKYN